MVKFIVWSALLTVLILIFMEAVGKEGWFELPTYRYVIALYLFFWTAVMGAFLLRKLDNPPIDFTSKYLLVMVIRMFLFAGFILVILFLDKAGAASNAAFFIVAYFLLTGFEVGFLVSRTRLKTGPPPAQKDP